MSSARRSSESVQRFDRRPLHLHVNVDAVEQRTRDPAAVSLYPLGAASAVAARVAEVTAGTGIHCRDELESRRIVGLTAGAGNRDPTTFHRFPQNFEHMSAEFR